MSTTIVLVLAGWNLCGALTAAWWVSFMSKHYPPDVLTHLAVAERVLLLMAAGPVGLLLRLNAAMRNRRGLIGHPFLNT